MGRRRKVLQEVRDQAVAHLCEAASVGRKPSLADWEHAMTLSGYSRRQLQRLVAERLDGEALDGDGVSRGAFTVDEDVVTAVFLMTGNIAGAYDLLRRMGKAGLPSVRHFRRAVAKQMGTLELAYARGGSKKARDFTVYLPTEVVRRNHTWELDHTELPIWVVPAGHKVAVRPWITAVLDRGTRYPLSWVVTFGRPSVEQVRACLVQAITSRLAPDGQTLVGGLPIRTVWDRGLEFLSPSITEACMRLGVIPVALPAYSPHLKPHVERLWRFLKERHLPTLPGYADRVSDLRGHSAIADACLGEAEFMLLLADWMDWYVTEHVHSSLGCTPLQAWQDDTTPIREVHDSQLWEDFLVAKSRAKVSKNGIRFDTIDFVAPELVGKVGRSLEIRYLPHDRSFVEVFDGADHVCTAIPRHALTADAEQEILEHRSAQQRMARARFTTANRVRRDSHRSTTALARNKKGQMVVVAPDGPEVDLLAGGDEAYAALVGIDNVAGQDPLW